jgi:hypothetical protein
MRSQRNQSVKPFITGSIYKKNFNNAVFNKHSVGVGKGKKSISPRNRSEFLAMTNSSNGSEHSTQRVSDFISERKDIMPKKITKKKRVKMSHKRPTQIN